MSGFIELCGAPGVGKSTLVRALCGRSLGSGGSAQVLLPAELLGAVPRHGLGWSAPLLRDPARVARLARLPAGQRLLVARSASGPADLDGRGVAGGHEFVLQGLPSPGTDDPRSEVGYRAAALGWARGTLHLTHAARGLPDRVVLLLDEGVVQRSVSLVGAGATDASRAMVVERFPTPALVVHLVGTAALLEERAEHRLAAGRAPRLHSGLDAERVHELVRSDAAAIDATVRLIEERGVAVVRVIVDGRTPRRAVAAAVMDGIEARWPTRSS